MNKIYKKYIKIRIKLQDILKLLLLISALSIFVSNCNKYYDFSKKRRFN